MLASSDLDPDLLSFIEGAIPSVWALELLILIRSEPRQAWSADALVADLRASGQLVADILASFETSGLVLRREDRFEYAPASPTLDQLCHDLQAAYRQRPVKIVNAITARRSDQLTGFAESFRFKGWRP